MMIVTTGFGYLTEITTGHIVSKYELAPGAYPLTNGYVQTEVASKQILDTIEVWKDPVSIFDFRRLWGTIWAGALSPIGLIEMPPYQTVIESMWFYPNRSAIYPFMQGLVSAGKATSGDLDIVVAAFSDQGIDITTIQ